MPFDPDAYLANKTASKGFDPDAYLAAKIPQQEPTTSAGQTALESFGQGLSSGYLPQLQAAAQPLTDKIFGLATGKKVEPESYTQSRDENIARIGKEEAEHPTAATTGRIGGAVAQALATPLPAALAPESLLGSIGKGAATGGAYGLIQNPGDTKGEVDPLQLKERGEQAIQGAKVGAIAGPASYGVSKLLGGIANSPESLKETANESAIKQSGAMLKDFRQLDGKGETQKFGQFLRDKGLVKAGDTFDDVAEKAQQLNQQSGKDLDSIYKQASAAQTAHLEDISNRFEKLPEKELKDVSEMGFSLSRDKDEIIGQAKEALKDQEGGPRAISRLSRYLNGLEKEYGGEILDPKKAQEIKSAIDKTINYSRNPLSKQPETEQAFSAARKNIANRIENQIEYLGQNMGTAGAKALKEANKNYGYSRKAMDIADDYMSRQSANRAFSLTDTIAGGAGGAVGSGVMAATGDHNPTHLSEGAIAGALLGGLANKYGRQYGPGLIAGGAGALSKVAPVVAGPAGAINTVLPQNALLRGLLNQSLQKKK